MSVQEIDYIYPKFSIGLCIYLKDSPDIHYTYEGGVPQEIIDQFQQIVGNGLARVSITVPMDLKDFGNGAGAHVSVSLSCNQDQNTIHQAHNLALQAALHYTKCDLAQALQEFDQILAQHKQTHPNQR